MFKRSDRHYMAQSVCGQLPITPRYGNANYVVLLLKPSGPAVLQHDNIFGQIKHPFISFYVLPFLFAVFSCFCNVDAGRFVLVIPFRSIS